MKKRVRKPRPLDGFVRAKIVPYSLGSGLVDLETDVRLYACECRKLATWLLKAAEWLEEKEKKK